MVTAQNLIYSVSAARRILGIYYPEIKVQIQVWKKVIWVWVEGRRPTFISKDKFKQHFVEWRKAQAAGLRIRRSTLIRSQFEVSNEAKGTSYNVIACTDGVLCECGDFKNQVGYLGKGCCKHGYAVLNYLGFSCLGEYLNGKQLQSAAA